MTSARGSRYGVTKTDVIASRSAISSTVRKRSSNSTCPWSPSSLDELLQRQAVALTFALSDAGVRPSGDDVERLGVPLDDRRQGPSTFSIPLPARAARTWTARIVPLQSSVATLRPPRPLPLRARQVPAGRRAERRGSSLPGRFHCQRAGAAAVSVITITSSAWPQSVSRTCCLVRGRLREHRVQGDDERLRQLLGERQDVFAVAAAEDAVLVLQQHHVDVPADRGCAPHVRSRRVFLARSSPRLQAAVAGRLVDDHNLRDSLDIVEPDQRSPDIGRKRSDSASTRRIGRDDRRAHPCGRAANLKSSEHSCTPIDPLPRGNRTATVLRCGGLPMPGERTPNVAEARLSNGRPPKHALLQAKPSVTPNLEQRGYATPAKRTSPTRRPSSPPVRCRFQLHESGTLRRVIEARRWCDMCRGSRQGVLVVLGKVVVDLVPRSFRADELVVHRL